MLKCQAWVKNEKAYELSILFVNQSTTNSVARWWQTQVSCVGQIDCHCITTTHEEAAPNIRRRWSFRFIKSFVTVLMSGVKCRWACSSTVLFRRVWDMVDRSHVFTRLRQLKLLSAVADVAATTISNWINCTRCGNRARNGAPLAGSPYGNVIYGSYMQIMLSYIRIICHIFIGRMSYMRTYVLHIW